MYESVTLRKSVLAARSLLRRVGVDHAIVFGLLTRIWSLVAGPVSILVIASRFSPELQGYYYTFNQLLAVKIFFELGLGTVIVQFASHEWSKLSLSDSGSIVGSKESLSRLASLARFSLRWYMLAGTIAALGLSIGGCVFFSSSPDLGIHWAAPWLSLCMLTGIDLALQPLWALLEGCNQVKQVYLYRMVLAILTNLAAWSSILLGAGLWSAPIYSVAGLLWALFFLFKNYRGFFRSLLLSMFGPRIDWRSEIWPLQWRIALSWLSGYFIYSLFTPVAFKLEGAVVAGQVGMTWTLVNAVSAISYIWVTTKMPLFGILIAKRDYAGLDRLFRKYSTLSIGTASLGAGAVWTGIYLLYWSGHPLATRFLPPVPAGLFLSATIINTVIYVMAIYLRAHKQEPYVSLSVATGVLVGLSTVLLGSRFGVAGMGAGYLGIMTMTMIIGMAIFRSCRAKWHSNVGFQPERYSFVWESERDL